MKDKVYTRYTIHTANYNNYTLCKSVCEKTGLYMHCDYRETCFKKYAITLIAKTIMEDEFLNLLILACTAHSEQQKFRDLVIKKAYAKK